MEKNLRGADFAPGMDRVKALTIHTFCAKLGLFHRLECIIPCNINCLNVLDNVCLEANCEF